MLIHGLIIPWLVLIQCFLYFDPVCSAPLDDMSNKNISSISNDTALGICSKNVCPEGKYCVEDITGGYKCCKNKKCTTKIRCRDPGDIDNATRIPEARRFTPKETVIYTCNTGFYLSMSGDISCLSNGTWSQPMPTCIPIGILNTPTTASKSTTMKPESTNMNMVIIIIIFLLFAVAVAVVGFLVLRNKNWNSRLRMLCRSRSYPVVLENAAFPSMPENLDDHAVPVNELAQYVALGHRNGDQKFRDEFEEIQNLSNDALTWEISQLPDNKEKNRYINIVAYDHSRVHLNYSSGRRRSTSNPFSDYINANYVSSYEKPKAYIACQGPLPETFNDFWKMIWENNVTIIVMITNLVENGRRKCDQYWPQDGREQYKHISVTLRDVDVYANYVVRSFQLRNTKLSKRRSRNNERRILQYHYTQWPDHGTPEYILPLLKFIRISSVANSSDSGPIIVHCSAGVGRTGTYIMLHSMIQMARITGKVNINKFLKFIRTQRNHLVQTEDQYVFVHDALLCQFTCRNTEIPAQQLNTYVQSLLSSSSIVEIAGDNLKNTAKDIESGGLKESSKITGMEKQFMIVAQHVSREIDYDFATRSINQNKNRPNGVLPIFRSRVPLHYRVGNEGSDYINASFLQGYRNGRMFIITQLPLPNTRKDFWQLVWDHNCSVVVTIRDVEWDEADIYWPVQDHHISCPSFNISFESEKKLSTKEGNVTEIVIRDFVLEATKDDYVLAVKQLDLSHWPNIDEIGPEFTQLINTIVKYTAKKDGSVIIQDRYGGISAGQLACVHSLHQELANENVVDVFQTARVAYQMRPHIFSSYLDLHFLYKAMLVQVNPSQFQKPVADFDKGNNTIATIICEEDDDVCTEKKALLSNDNGICITQNDSESEKCLQDVSASDTNTGSATTERSNLSTSDERANLIEEQANSSTIQCQIDLDDSVMSEGAKLL
ncbi:receptor-type tyrosine-protein phosphatase gamma-like [Styela clava]